MTISVIIPAYNAEEFLAETLESVLAQSARPAEVIVIDDGSTDQTAAIAESFAPRVQLHRQSNRGLAASRNVGVEHCTGDLIAFIDADDLWEPEKLAMQLEAMARNPKADLCFTGHEEFRRVDGENLSGTIWLAPVHITSYRDIFFRTQFLPSSVLMKRTSFWKVGGFTPGIKISEDTDFFMRLFCAHCEFIGCPEPLLKYRKHESSMSSNRQLILVGRRENFNKHVRPLLRGVERVTVAARFYSYIEGELAYCKRAAGDPACLMTMIKGIAFWPFAEPIRYKILAHMLLIRLGVLPRKV